jgi:hypothetical protein
MLKGSVTALAVIVLTAHTVNAEPGLQNEPKSVDKAKKLSLYGTLIPVAAGAVIFFGASDRFDNWDDAESIVAISIAGAGIVFGPAIGHCYAGEWRYLGKAFWLRMSVAGLSVGAFAYSSTMGGNSSAGGAVLPALVITASAVYDIAAARKSVEKYNARHNLTSLSLVPCYYASQDAVGMQLRLTF